MDENELRRLQRQMNVGKQISLAGSAIMWFGVLIVVLIVIGGVLLGNRGGGDGTYHEPCSLVYGPNATNARILACDASK